MGDIVASKDILFDNERELTTTIHDPSVSSAPDLDKICSLLFKSWQQMGHGHGLPAEGNRILILFEVGSAHPNKRLWTTLINPEAFVIGSHEERSRMGEER
ncbi:uncharacterized protein PHALS_12915 [Plasmopara halstedii]|uniref:Uncharacterized protein n=1 Tax=Plasmopara halstedii TaxID=4781 RepID=A0A0N7L5X1_PLAHL|nr:uncharacterized protein PHALS_12915 [Plasmopara halstedii]CEG42659.1 hypothetical protein PHALS_12915 [Plasmopara halstedii]|eukprot:XP_024579028.1 hypothetical protein PHALS_12915 [Plasmopara halstedii]